ncbi:MAG: 2-hydroxyacid dehydrogenase [Candidatus Thorarchaeota archaeon]
MLEKPRVFFTSNVFTANEVGDNKSIDQDIRGSIKKLWSLLEKIADIEIYNGRFPDKIEIETFVNQYDPIILGCHLSHSISAKLLEKSNLIAICTATAGYNHIEQSENNNVLITHTPGVLYETVADYTIALIMSNLRNLIDLHNSVWNGNWTPSEKWDMDQKLSQSLKNQVLGIVGLGEIGSEVAKKLQNFDLKVLYYDIQRNEQLEHVLPHLEYVSNLKELFAEADIISLHVPLNKNTENLIDYELLKIMKYNSLLVNTARGKILNLNHFLDLLERKEISVNFAFDVYPEEPINKETLKRIKAIKKSQPDLRMILMPHNASADANTRGKMVILLLEDIIKLIQSKGVQDLNDVHIIPEQRNKLQEINWRIKGYWKQQ